MAQAALLAPRALPGSLRRLLGRIIATVVGLAAVLAVPGTALAYTQPVRPESDTVPVLSPDSTPASVSHGSSSGWGLTTILTILVIAIVAAVLLAVVQRIARHHRAAHPTALSV